MKYLKSIKKNAFVLVLILVIILYCVLKDDFLNIINTLIKADIKWILVAVLFIVIYWFLRALCLYSITREYSKKIKFKKIFSLTLITQFFNGITPFSSGGQPMEVYYLSKAGIKASKGTNIILQNFIMYQMALILYGIIAIFLNYYFHFFKEVAILKELTLIGFIVNTLVGVGLLFVSFSTKFNKMIVSFAIKFCHKIKLVKNIDETAEKWTIRLNEFHESAELFKRKKLLFLKGFIYNFMALGCFYIIPLFVIYGMGHFDITPVQVIVSSAYVMIIGAFVPIPGGSGGIEFGFLQFLGNFVTGSILSASLLVWRFITYYIGIIIGAVAINFYKGDERKCE